MKISVFIETQWGGATRYILELSEQLQKRNNTINVFLSCNQKTKNKISVPKGLNIKYFFTSCNTKFKIAGYYYFLLHKLKYMHKQILHEMEKDKPDVLIIGQSQFTQTPLIARHIRRTPTLHIFNEHKREFYEQTSFDYFSFKKKLLRTLLTPIEIINKNNLQLLASRKNIFTVVNSRFTQINLSTKYNYQSSKVIYPGISTQKFKYNKNVKKTNQFLSVGSLVYHKGFDFVIRSISNLPIAHRQLTIVCNEGYDKKHIVALANKKRVKLVIKENINDQELIEEYNKSRLFLYAPINEPFGLVVLEAMSCGLPIVATKSGGYSEIIRNKQNGLLTDRNPKSFAKAIENILNNRALYKKISKNAISTGKDYSWENKIKEFEKVLEEVVNYKHK